MTQRPRLSGPDTATRPVRAAAVPAVLSHLPPPHEYLRAARPFHFPHPHAPCPPGRPVAAGAASPLLAHVRPARQSQTAVRALDAARPPGRRPQRPRARGRPAALPKALGASPRRAARVHRCTTLPPANPLKASRHFASPAPPLGEAHQILARPLLPSRAARTHATQGGSGALERLSLSVPSPWREPSARPPRCRSRARGAPPLPWRAAPGEGASRG